MSVPRLPSAKQLHVLLCLALFLLLSACAIDRQTATLQVNPEARRQVQQLLGQKRYTEAASELKQILAAQPSLTDALLYADLLEATGKDRDARDAYRKAQSYPGPAEEKTQLYFRLAMLETAVFDNSAQARRLMQKLPSASAENLNIQAMLALKVKNYQTTLQLAEKAENRATDNEMRAWAHFLSANSWLGRGKENETFGELFNAINHARGYGLVARITTLWDDLRFKPSAN